MKKRIVDEEIVLIPYFPNEEVTLQWYQDKELCKQVDNRDETYSVELLRAMYAYLSANGECYYIEYKGILVGDVTLKDDSEIAIVVCKEYQNRHIGRRCIRAMVELAREKKFSVVKANIYSFNTQSRNMFLNAGFVQIADEWFQYSIK